MRAQLLRYRHDEALEGAVCVPVSNRVTFARKRCCAAAGQRIDGTAPKPGVFVRKGFFEGFCARTCSRLTAQSPDRAWAGSLTRDPAFSRFLHDSCTLRHLDGRTAYARYVTAPSTRNSSPVVAAAQFV